MLCRDFNTVRKGSNGDIKFASKFPIMIPVKKFTAE